MKNAGNKKTSFIAPMNRKTHEKRRKMREDFDLGRDVFMEIPEAKAIGSRLIKVQEAKTIGHT